jgi:4-hydroxy-tetrahydrodipicolinate synthase
VPNTPFAGIYPILYAFFDREERIDERAMAMQVEACIRAGAHGIAVLGFVTEFNKLAAPEKQALCEMVAGQVAGRVPLAVTLSETNVPSMIAQARAAKAAGAAWLILQPPQVRGLPESALENFFDRVIDATDLPCAIQIYPAAMDVVVSPATLASLSRRHANFRLLKGEGGPVYLKRVIEMTDGRLDVFDGRGGLEYPASFRAGAVGVIPAPDVTDALVAVHRALAAGDDSEADRRHAEALPLIGFMMGLGTPEHFVCYGKRFFAARAGIGEVASRAPSAVPEAYGLAQVERHLRRWGKL